MVDPLGLSKSPAGSRNGEDVKKCSRCGTTIRIEDEICVRCLLGEGAAEAEGVTREEFLNGLQEAAIPDNEWRFGNYEVLSEIGRGGMGVIYRARQRYSRRVVALKRVLSYHAQNRDWMERFRRETEAAASLDHPNILPIYEVGETDSVPFFSMKLASGGSLRDVGARMAKEPRKCVLLMSKVARAIGYAHQRGILHRDIQPGNILLDDNDEPLVGDFGLAKWLDGSSDLTRTITAFGTPGYIAPEQARGPAAELKPAADIYSLGAVLFNLLALRPPFVGPNVLSVLNQAATSDAPKLRNIAPAIDRDLETIVARCLERDPSARYQSAVDLAEDLESWLDARPIRAKPVSILAHFSRWSRRNPLLAVAEAFCMILAVGIVWLLFNRTEPPKSGLSYDKSIAVLPFENFAAGQNDPHFGDVLQDDILTDLAKVADLKVISRSSVRDYKAGAPRDLHKIAAALGVRYLLEGSVNRTGERFRINAHLSDAKTGSQTWADNYEGNLSDIFATQSEIAQTIANRLRAQLSVAERNAITSSSGGTTNLRSYDLYLEAKELIGAAMATKDAAATFQKAVLLLDEATRLDQSFLPAFCELARANGELYWNDMDRTPERLALAKQALDAAVRINPDLGETHVAKARYYYVSSRDYNAARRELEIAQRTLPNNSSLLAFEGLLDRRQNRWKEGLSNLRRANDLDPRNPETIRALADTYMETRQYGAMEQLLKRALVIAPQHALVISAKLADCYLARGDCKSVVAMFDRVPPNAGPAGFQSYYRFTANFYLRDYAAAQQAIAGSAFIPDSFKGPFCPPSWFEGLLALSRNDREKSEAAFSNARRWVETAWGENPSDPARLSIVSQIDAALGQKEVAIEKAKEAVALRPLNQDSLDGPSLVTNLALVYSWVGENDLAIQQLALVTNVPAGPSYGDLQLNPRWDKLRSLARFQSMVDAVRPKE